MKKGERDRIGEEALELPPSKRRAFVTQACQGDEDAIRSVFRFIEFEPPADFLAEPIVEGGELLGRQIGGFVLLNQLGSGGHSIVYGVTRASSDTTPAFALKLLRQELRNSEALVARFRTEQETLQQLQHPSIAKLIDSGSFQGCPYFVMELVRHSRTITEYCRQEGLELHARLRLFESVCEAVTHAHQHGIIHRDIKPTNILVEVDPLTGAAMPKLIDFGIAKVLEPHYLTTLVETGPGDLVGTRSHASPEQILRQPTDIRTDVYGLGLVLYELLTDEPVMDVSSRPSDEELRRVICDRKPERPSERCRRTGRTAPGRLDWVVLMALEKKADRRYGTVAALQQDVRHFRNGKPISAQPPTLVNATIDFVREYQFITVGIVLLVAAACFTSWYAYRAQTAERLAENLLAKIRVEIENKTQALDRLESAEAETAEHLEKSQKINAALMNIISPPKDVSINEYSFLHSERLRQASREIGNDLAGEPLVEANLRWVLANSFRAYGDHKNGLREAEISAALFRQHLGPQAPDTLRSEHMLADMLLRNARLAEAHELAEKVLAARLRAHGPGDERTGETSMLLSDICAGLGRYQESLIHLEKIDSSSDVRQWSALTDSIAFRRAGRYASLGRLDDAQKQWELILEYRRNALGVEDPETLAAQYGLAGIHLQARRATRAEGLYRDALQKLTKTYPDHVMQIAIMRNLAGAVSWQGRRAEAEELLLEVIFLEQRLNGKERGGDPVTLCRYARLLRDREAFEDAERIMAFVMYRQTETHPDTSLNVAASIEALASIAHRQGKHGFECYWQIRLVMAYLQHYGWWHEATQNTTRKALEAGAHTCKVLLTNHPFTNVVQWVLEVHGRMGMSDQRPVVVEDAGRFVLDWAK